jgi:predicted transcriptional regulator
MVRLSILKVSIRQLKAARALLAWSQEQLAAAADVSIPTIKRLEAQDGPLGGRDETGSKIRRRRRVHRRERRGARRAPPQTPSGETS